METAISENSRSRLWLFSGTGSIEGENTFDF